MSLRPYQQRIVTRVMSELSRYKKPFVVDAFQASGKSWMVAEIAKRVGKCLVLCMNKELVEQDVDKIRKVGASCSIYSASCGEKIIGHHGSNHRFYLQTSRVLPEVRPHHRGRGRPSPRR